jgi:nitrogen fixation protein FixH
MTEKQSAWRSPWVLGWIGLLVVIVTANGIMIYLAQGSNPGLVVPNYYQRGQDYEKNLAKRLARDPGWKMVVEAPKFVDVGKPALWGFQVTDKEGVPVQPDAVTFYAYRPADHKQDFNLPMQAVAPGRYQAEISFPLLGVWDILVSVRQGEDEFNQPHRISAGVK